MKKECEFIINKIYPDDWEKYNEKEQEKKEKEFGVALWLTRKTLCLPKDH